MCTQSILDANSVSNYMAITAAFSRLFILRKKNSTRIWKPWRPKTTAVPRVIHSECRVHIPKEWWKPSTLLYLWIGLQGTIHSVAGICLDTFKKGCPKAYRGALIDHNRADEVRSLFWTTMLLCPAQKVCTFGKLSAIMYGCAVLPRYTLQYLFLRYATERITQCEPTLNYTEGESTTECSSDKDKRILCIIMC